MAAIVESPTKRTLGFTRGAVVVVVVVDSIVVSDATVVVVVLVVVVDSSGAVTESAPETDDPTLTTNAALNKPAITRFVNLFITLTAYTAGNFPQPNRCQILLSCARSPQKVSMIRPEPRRQQSSSGH